LVLWIDPLDGTKKFAAKQFDEVSVLIGISYDKRPIAGVMHLPFHGEHGTTFWGK
jgi:3'(2'), 5'-bisphosphate nucleotidase